VGFVYFQVMIQVGGLLLSIHFAVTFRDLMSLAEHVAQLRELAAEGAEETQVSYHLFS
jgi:hypothetical protein